MTLGPSYGIILYGGTFIMSTLFSKISEYAKSYSWTDAIAKGVSAQISEAKSNGANKATTRTKEAYDYQQANKYKNTNSGASVLNNQKAISASVAKEQAQNELITRQAAAVTRAANSEWNNDQYNRDITYQLDDDQNYLTVINNSADYTGTRSTQYGFLESKYDGYADGTVCFVNGKGELTPIDLSTASEDYIAQVSSFKSEYTEAKDKFELSHKFQEMAKEGSEESTVDTEDSNQTNSALDIVTNTINLIAGDDAELTEKLSTFLNLTSNPISAATTLAKQFLEGNITDHNFSAYKDSMFDYLETKQVAQLAYDNLSDMQTYQDMYDTDPMTAITKLMDSDKSDREKKYIAYKMVSGDDKSLADYAAQGGINLLSDLGESLDWLANPVKGSVQYLYYKHANENSAWFNEEHAEYFEGKDYKDVLESLFQASWQNEGRKSYNYDTGNIAVDMCLEIISDPEFLVSQASKGASKVAGSEAVEAIRKSGLEIADETALKYTIKDAIRDGKSIDEVADAVAKQFPIESRAGVRQILSDALEYRKAFKLSESLNVALDAKNAVDKAMLTATGLPLAGKAVSNLVQVIAHDANATEEAAAKIFNDALTETLGNTENDKLTLDITDQFFDRLNKNTFALSLDNVQSWKSPLTKDVKLDIVSGVYQDGLSTAYKQAAEELKAQGIKTTDVRASEEYMRLKANLDTKFISCMVRNDLTDTPMYHILTRKGYNEFSYAKDSAVTDLYQASSNLVYNTGDAVKKITDKVSVPSALNNMDKYTWRTLDKIQAIKLNDKVIGESYANSKKIQEMMNAVYTGDYGLLGVAASDSQTGTAQLVRKMLANEIGVRNYNTISNALDKTTLSRVSKDELLDRLYNKSMRNRAARMMSGGVDCTDEYMMKESRSFVKQWLNETNVQEVYHSGIDTGNFHTNTWDTEVNVANIDKMFMNGKGIDGIGKYDVNIIYSAFVDSQGTLDHITFKIKDDVFTCKPEEIEDTLLPYTHTTAQDVKVNFIGAYQHASGFDTDTWIRKYFMSSTYNKAKYWFQDTIDLGELVKCSAGDVTQFSDQIVDTLEEAVHTATKQWQESKELLKVAGVNPKCSFTAPRWNNIQQLGDLVADVSCANETERAIYDYIAPELTELSKATSETHEALQKNIDVFLSDYSTGAQLYGAGGNNIGSKVIFDYRAISKYFDVDDLCVADALKYEDAAESIKNIKASWRPDVDHLFYNFRDDINTLWDQVSTEFDWRYNPKSIQDKVAIMQYEYQNNPIVFYTTMHDQKIDELLTRYNVQHRIFGPTLYYHNAFMEALRNPYDYLQGSTNVRTMEEIKPGEWEKISEKLPGAIEDPMSSYNQMMELTKRIDELDQKFEDRVELEHLLEREYKDTDLGVVKLRTADGMFEHYKGLRDELKEIMEADFAEMHSDAMASASTPLQKFKAQKYSPKSFKKLNTDMAKWYQDKAMAGVIFQNALDDNQWLSYMHNYCADKMIIFKQFTTPDDLTKLASRPGAIITDAERYITVSIPKATEKVEDIVPTLERWDDLHKSLPNKVQDTLYYLADANDESFKYGLPIAYDGTMNNFIVNKFFNGAEDMLDQGSRNQYLCGYMGPIDELLGEGSYASGNLYSNLFNSYNQTYTKVRTAKDILNNMFSGTTLRDYAAGYEVKDIIDYMKAQDKYPVFKTYDGIISLTDDYTKHLDDDVIFLSPEERTKLIDMVSTGVEDNTPKWLEVFKKARNVESSWICGYLYSNPATWMHNWVDSTTKAWIAEGSSHFHWMTEAMESNKNYESLLDSIAELRGYSNNGFVKLGDIDWFFSRHAGYNLISQERAHQMWRFWDSTISESKFGELIKNPDKMTVSDKLTAAFTKSKYIQFNMDRFSDCETINRVAIFLKHINEGDTIEKSIKAIEMSQFNYAKTPALTVLDTIAPFSTFKLYNYEYWLSSVWDKPGATNKINGIIGLYNNDQEDRYSDYWDEETLQYRAWLDTLDFERDQKGYLGSYNKFEDFMGNKKATAQDQGWVSIGDKLYLKLGLSLIDAVSGLTTIADPFSNVFQLLNPETYTNLMDALQDCKNGTDVSQWISDHGYDVVNMLPLLGTGYYMLESGIRNGLMYNKLNENGKLSSLLTTLLPGMFAPGDYKTYDRTLPTDKEIGQNWYDMTRTERKQYQYVNGVSYLNSWIAKDPATYINHWGRLQELTGFNNAQMTYFMEIGGGFWFTQNNEGAYELHNYKLINNDEDTYNNLLTAMINFGWSEDKAKDLLEQASENPWRTSSYSSGSTYQSSNQYYATSTGYGRLGNSGMSKYMYNQIRYAGADSEFSKFSGSWSRYDKHPKQYNLANQLSYGKNSTYASDYAKRRVQSGHALDSYRRSVHRWHTRTRDIYSNNYARYGASRMAMEQNLKNYSNRSITEMRRTNQNMRYSTIHRHTAW